MAALNTANHPWGWVDFGATVVIGVGLIVSMMLMHRRNVGYVAFREEADRYWSQRLTARASEERQA